MLVNIGNSSWRSSHRCVLPSPNPKNCVVIVTGFPIFLCLNPYYDILNCYYYEIAVSMIVRSNFKSVCACVCLTQCHQPFATIVLYPVCINIYIDSFLTKLFRNYPNYNTMCQICCFRL